MKSYFFLLGITITYLLFSCNYIPCGLTSDLKTVNKIPSIAELAGVYKTDPITDKTIPQLGRAEITLASNNTLTFKNIPIEIFDFEEKTKGNRSVINGIGKWSLGPEIKKPQINLNLSFTGHEAGYITSYRLYTTNGSNVIFIIVGDPDECIAARFVQQKYSR